VDWHSLDWPTLDRLREIFLSGAPPGPSYWRSRSDLENYNVTFAQRIGWKWDSVLRELERRRWRPPAGVVLDWGCGSGIAARRVVGHWGIGHFDAVRFHDQSPLATQFAVNMARLVLPAARVEPAAPGWLSSDEPISLLLLSHVLAELDERAQAGLLALTARARAVLWVEPGTWEISRQLIAFREKLRDRFTVIAPCTHQAPCGMLAPVNARHWCHHFAQPPAGIMADSDWVRFAQRAGIDLRSLPCSFLVLQKSLAPSLPTDTAAPFRPAEDCSRIIGRPRFYKGYAKIFSCQHDGVRDLILRKRSAPALFKALEKGGEGGIYWWELDGELIRTGRPADAPAWPPSSPACPETP
jgi:hypothetical protein